MAPIATVVIRKMDIAMKNMKYNGSYASNDLMDTAGPYKDASESTPSLSESGSEEPLHSKASKPRSKRRYHKRENRYVKRHLSSFRSSNEKYQSCSESEFEGDDRSVHKRHNRQRRVEDSGTDRDSLIYTCENSRHRQRKKGLIAHPVNGHF